MPNYLLLLQHHIILCSAPGSAIFVAEAKIIFHEYFLQFIFTSKLIIIT
jgi:hypothetical protein